MSADCLFFIWRAPSRSSSAVPSVASPSGEPVQASSGKRSQAPHSYAHKPP
jgi:hypothetical protein